jgi:ATP-dependent DNA helicase RecQ
MFSWMINRLGARGFTGKPQTAENRLIDQYSSTVGKNKVDEKRILRRMQVVGGSLRCLVSTNAFGMGINCPDIDAVMHWGMPATVPSYWQQVGRAGRDGREALALCFAHPFSIGQAQSGMREVVKSSECIRTNVLKKLEMRGMDMAPLHRLQSRKSCAQQCNECSCTFCCCCVFCKTKCPCRQVAMHT